MLNKDRFASAKEMESAFLADPCIHKTWCFAVWCFVEWTEDRVEYLRRLSREHMWTCALSKEIARLDKTAKKGDEVTNG